MGQLQARRLAPAARPLGTHATRAVYASAGRRCPCQRPTPRPRCGAAHHSHSGVCESTSLLKKSGCCSTCASAHRLRCGEQACSELRRRWPQQGAQGVGGAWSRGHETRQAHRLLSRMPLRLASGAHRGVQSSPLHICRPPTRKQGFGRGAGASGGERRQGVRQRGAAAAAAAAGRPQQRVPARPAALHHADPASWRALGGAGQSPGSSVQGRQARRSAMLGRHKRAGGRTLPPAPWYAPLGAPALHPRAPGFQAASRMARDGQLRQGADQAARRRGGAS